MNSGTKTIVAAVSLFLPVGTMAAPISVDAGGDRFEVFHFRDFRGPNSIGFTPGDRLTFGAINVVPNATAGTTGVARQGGVEAPLFDVSNDTLPNQFASSVDFDPALTGSWTLNFANGPDRLSVNTPAPGAVAPTPLATDLTLSGPKLAPTISWVAPVTPDRVVISLYDLERRSAIDVANRIFVDGTSGDATSFTLPGGILEENGLYSVGVEFSTVYTDGLNPSGSSQAGASRSRSRAFFDFSTGDLPDVPSLFLPQTDTSGDTPVFNFDNAVVADRIEFYDPFVAIGYDYEIGAGDPLFGSVILPDIGDGAFDLLLDDGSGFQFVEELMAGEEYDFGAGVAAFRILGVELSAGLDPADGAAFVTGLSFVADGRFTGTMTPITQFVAPIPAPPAGLLLGSALLAGVAMRRSKRKTA